MPQAPWEKYAQLRDVGGQTVETPPALEGPWLKYGAPAAPAPSTSLMESRRAASKSEFEQNQPESTILTRARELVLGGAEGLGADLQSPILGTAKNLVGGIASLGKSAVTAPLQTAKGIVGGIAGAVTEGPGNVLSGFAEGDYDRAARGAGQTITTTLPATYGAAKATQKIANAVRDPQVAKLKQIRAMEQKMAPSGKEARLGTERIAPELVDDPVLMKAKAVRFNQKLFERYKAAGPKVQAAEQSVPRGTTIPQQQITDGLETIIDKYRDMGADDAAKAVAREWEKWANKSGNIDWDDFLQMKRRLGKQMEVMGQFRESGTAAEKAAGQAMKEAYRVVSQSGSITPELQAANHEFWLMSSAMDDAGLSYRSGRKIMEIAAPDQPGLVKKAVKTALPWAVGGGVMGEVVRRLY